MSRGCNGEGEESKIFGKNEIIEIVPLKRVDPENDIEFRQFRQLGLQTHFFSF
ncbi:MAG: hypothetical protein M3044_02185 [Thermoproteota archaeon]|nr:hypothetical protein [Thermoproteota archaeon]